MSVTYLNSLQNSLHELLKDNEKVIIFGEDIEDPYGGAFKVTKGLSSEFPQRVFNTPISEAAITGLGAGLALRGYLPIVEIMFGDFLTLCADQIVNHITKFPELYPGVTVPIVIRAPMGAGRGYGATHSQSIEKFFMGVPGLSIISPSIFHDPGALLVEVVQNNVRPSLFIEQKSLYPKTLVTEDNSEFNIKKEIYGESNFPVMVVSNHKTSADLVIISYGSVSQLLSEIMYTAVDDEINLTCVLPAEINQNITSYIMEILKLGSKFLIIEDGTNGFNWASEVGFQLHKLANKKIKVDNLASNPNIIPAREDLEKYNIVTKEKIEKTIWELI